MKKRSSVLLSILALGALVLGMSPGAAVQAADVYKIGGIFSVTGPASFLGDPEKKSLEMAIDEINAAGGIDGRKLEAVIYDSEGDPSKAVLAANRLISRDRVTAIVGTSLTPTTLAVMPIVERNKIPMISCAAGIAITEPVQPWVFKTAQSDALAVGTIYKHMQQSGINKIGILTVENAFGESGKHQLENKAADYGIEIVQAASFGGRDTDMTAQLTRIRSAEPQAIVCWGTNPGPAVVARNLRQLNIDIPLYQSHGVASPRFIELAEDAADGNFLPTGKILVADQLADEDPQKEVLSRYIEDFEKRFQLTVSGFGGYAYDAMYLLAAAMKGSDGDKGKIRSALEGVQNHVGVTGVFNFSPEDHNGLSSDAFVMVRIQEGGWKLIGE